LTILHPPEKLMHNLTPQAFMPLDWMAKKNKISLVQVKGNSFPNRSFLAPTMLFVESTLTIQVSCHFLNLGESNRPQLHGCANSHRKIIREYLAPALFAIGDCREDPSLERKAEK
jgi:hypothetical protein